MRLLVYTIAAILISFTGFGQNIQTVRTMSQSYTTYAETDISALTSNQAGLHDLQGLSVEASALQRYFSEGVLELNLGVALPLGEYTGGGIFVRRFGDDIFSEQSFGLAIGRKLFESFSMGIALETYQISIENYGSNLQFNTQIGFQAEISKAIRIGTHIFLPLSEVENLSYSNQSVFNFDVEVQAEKHLKVKAGFRKLNDHDIGIKASLTYEPLDKLEIHTGVLTFPTQYSFGAGIELFQGIQFLGAGLYQPDLGWSSGINIRYVPKK